MSSFEDGSIVWACAFDMDLDRKEKKVKHNLCKPVKGIILGGKFYELKKDGTPKKKSVYLMSRHLAKTEEECKKVYNTLIQRKQDYLKEMINYLEKEKVK